MQKEIHLSYFCDVIEDIFERVVIKNVATLSEHGKEIICKTKMHVNISMKFIASIPQHYFGGDPRRKIYFQRAGE